MRVVKYIPFPSLILFLFYHLLYLWLYNRGALLSLLRCLTTHHESTKKTKIVYFCSMYNNLIKGLMTSLLFKTFSFLITRIKLFTPLTLSNWIWHALSTWYRKKETVYHSFIVRISYKSFRILYDRFIYQVCDIFNE